MKSNATSPYTRLIRHYEDTLRKIITAANNNNETTWGKLQFSRDLASHALEMKNEILERKEK
jgi:hypothetical protein